MRFLERDIIGRPEDFDYPDPMLSRLAAARVPDPGMVSPGLKRLDDPATLADLPRAGKRLALALERGEPIALVTDHDGDGIGACATLWRGLVDCYGADPGKVFPVVTHRLKEGYGLSDPVVDRLLAMPDVPSLVITADQGSADNDRILRLAEEGIDVIVTDHHHIPGAGAESAHAFVNPLRSDSGYPDRSIAGGMVAWLLLVELGRHRKAQGDLRVLLDFVSISTVSDCVTLGTSLNNRAVVRYGLKLINGRGKPWSEAFFRLAGIEGVIGAQDIAFQVAPTLSARGRLDEAATGVRFLLSSNLDEAMALGRVLFEENMRRKQIEGGIVTSLSPMALAQAQAGREGLVLYDADNHPGVQGIACSRLGERFERPVIVLSPKVGGQGITGSSRAIHEWFDVRAALEAIDRENPGLLSGYGGHAAAAGLSLPDADPGRIERLGKAFSDAVHEQRNGRPLELSSFYDGDAPPDRFGPDFLRALRDLEPFGCGFEPPAFAEEFKVEQARPIGDGSHLRLTLSAGGRRHGAVWFRANEIGGEPPLSPGETAALIYTPAENTWNGTTRVDLRIGGVLS